MGFLGFVMSAGAGLLARLPALGRRRRPEDPWALPVTSREPWESWPLAVADRAQAPLLGPWRPFPSVPEPDEQADRLAVVGALARALHVEGELARRTLRELAEALRADPGPQPSVLVRAHELAARALRHASLLGSAPDPDAAQPVDLDLLTLVREATALAHATLAEHVRFHLHRELGAATVHADPTQLFYVVAGLLLRAGACAEDGGVQLVLEPVEPGELRLTVTALSRAPHRSFGFDTASLADLLGPLGGSLRVAAAPRLRFDLLLPARVRSLESVASATHGRRRLAASSRSSTRPGLPRRRRRT